MCVYTVLISHPGLPHCTTAGGSIYIIIHEHHLPQESGVEKSWQTPCAKVSVCWVITVAVFPWYPPHLFMTSAPNHQYHTLPWQLPPPQATREMPTSLSPLFLIHESVRTVEKYVCLCFEDASYH